MVSSGKLRRVALVGADVSEELSASFIRVTRTTTQSRGSNFYLGFHFLAEVIMKCPIF
jgi:hypothetical protein